MKQRKYTLPRHTNLAKNSSRVGAFIIDIAITLAVTLVFVYGCFQFIFGIAIKPVQSELETEQINSHLRYRNDKGEMTQIESEAPFEDFRGIISYYYMNYLTGDVEVPGTGSRLADEKIKLEDGSEVSKKDYYTVSWFNANVLKMGADPDNDSTCLFTYEKDAEGHYVTSKLGIAKDPSKATPSDINKFMQQRYIDAYMDSFLKLSYVESLSNRMNFLYTAQWVTSALLGSIVTYIVLPLFLKNGQTLGKKVYGLGLANIEGYKFSNRQLPMRLMPFAVVDLALLIPVWYDIFYILLVLLIVFLVSFAISMASPKRTALHDFTARTIVIDLKGSIIFENEVEEEIYINKEDNIDVKEVVSGEEPELKYEK